MVISRTDFARFEGHPAPQRLAPAAGSSIWRTGGAVGKLISAVKAGTESAASGETMPTGTYLLGGRRGGSSEGVVVQGRPAGGQGVKTPLLISAVRPIR